MCASTITLVHIPRVCYAAPDVLFHGLETVLREHPFANERMPEREGPMHGRIAALAKVLPLPVISFWSPKAVVLPEYRRLTPQHLDVAERLLASVTLASVAKHRGTVVD